MKNAGLIFNDAIHYIDHLAPFCALQKWPLITVESKVFWLCKKYYPELKVIRTDIWNIPFPENLVSCYPSKLLKAAFPSMDPSTKMFWLPHGNSDKGWVVPYFEALSDETALIYGQKMEDFLKKKQVNVPTIRIGNFRLHYWLKYRAFYEKKIPLPKPPQYLYAPTWNDPENNSSFWQIFPLIAAALPKNVRLIVKIHPNMQKQDSHRIEQLKGQYAQNPNIVFLDEFCPIYPLLDCCSAYIGDMSSIGYDFLYWNRPMYFINAKQRDAKTDLSLFLFRCGFDILPTDIGSIFTTKDLPQFQSIRQKTYEYTFDRCNLRRI